MRTVTSRLISIPTSNAPEPAPARPHINTVKLQRGFLTPVWKRGIFSKMDSKTTQSTDRAAPTSLETQSPLRN